LHAAARLLLDVLDIGAAVAYDLGAEIEARDRLEADWNLLFRPFTLRMVSLIE